MKTLNLTDSEFAVLVRAFESFNDFSNDTLFDDVNSVNLYPQEAVAVTPEQFAALRNELEAVVNRALALRSLADKLGVELNSEGYVV